MPKKLIALVIALILGVAASVAVAVTTGPTTGTVTASACATATLPAHTVGVDGTDVSTIAGTSTQQCTTQTQTYTVPTVTQTVTASTTATAPPTTSTGTTTTAPLPGVTPVNCFSAPAGAVDYAKLDACGYPSPNSTGVPAGTALKSVASINCSNTTLTGLTTTGSVTLGNNCTLINSKIVGQIVVQNGITGVNLSHDELSGSSTNGACNVTSTKGNSSDIIWEGAASGVTLNADYLHCAAEPFNGNGIVKNSYIVSDECWGPCGSSATTHNEAVYIAGGGSGGTDLDHNTIINSFAQTAGIFGDDHAFGPIKNLTINNNLVADGGDNGQIATGDKGDGNVNVNITNNRLSYFYDSGVSAGGDTAATWTGNFRDDNLATVPVNG